MIETGSKLLLVVTYSWPWTMSVKIFPVGDITFYSEEY